MSDPNMSSAQFIADTNKEIHTIKHAMQNLSASQMQIAELNEKNAKETANRIAELSAKVTLLHESSLAAGHPAKIERLENFMEDFLEITNMKDYKEMNEETKLNSKWRTQWGFLWVGITSSLSLVAIVISVIKALAK